MNQKYDMDMYQRRRQELSRYSDRQLTFRALAFMIAYSQQTGLSYEYYRALIDELNSRAEMPESDNERGPVEP